MSGNLFNDPHKTYIFEIHVIDNNTDGLLSRNTAYDMGLVTNVNKNLGKLTGCLKVKICSG